MSQLHPAMAAALATVAPPAESLRVAHYRLALRVHDWRHEFSDSVDVRMRGSHELAALRMQQQELDPDFRIWNEHCHPHCQNGRRYPSWA